jgi:hypothetical protein
MRRLLLRHHFFRNNPRWKKARCRNCRKLREIRTDNGLCTPCRSPLQIRALREVGVLWGTAGTLLYLLKKLKARGMSRRQIETFIETIHPRVMWNVKLDSAWRFAPKNKKLRWMRRSGWIDA